MNEDWRNELITKGAAFDALTEIENQYEFEDGHDHLMGWAKTKIFALPPVQPEKRTEERTETHARDLIDRQAAIDALGEKPLVWDDLSDFDLGKAAQWADDVDAIKGLPPAQPQRMKGRWTRKNDGVYCSACYKGWDFMTGVPAEVETEYKFCPNCGADMRGEQDETD